MIKIAFAGVWVHDQDEALAFYTGKLGWELRADVTAEQESVHVKVWLDGIETLTRHFQAARRTDVELLAEAIEAGGRDPISVGSIRMAAALAGGESASNGDRP